MLFLVSTFVAAFVVGFVLAWALERHIAARACGDWEE